jgi:hypothetical protein
MDGAGGGTAPRHATPPRPPQPHLRGECCIAAAAATAAAATAAAATSAPCESRGAGSPAYGGRDAHAASPTADGRAYAASRGGRASPLRRCASSSSASSSSGAAALPTPPRLRRVATLKDTSNEPMTSLAVSDCGTGLLTADLNGARVPLLLPP